MPGALAGMLSALSLSLLGIGWGLDPEIIKAEDARSY